MRVYSLWSNVYKDACESDVLEDVLDMMGKVLRAGPIGTQVHVSVRDVPKELWDAQPAFNDWKEMKKDGQDKD